LQKIRKQQQSSAGLEGMEPAKFNKLSRMNWFNSESILIHVILIIDAFLGTADLVLAAASVKYAYKEPSSGQKRKLEILNSLVAVILAVLAIINVAGWWRVYALEEKAEEQKAIAEAQKDKEKEARIKDAVAEGEAPRHLSDAQIQYAHELLGKYPGTSFMLDVYQGFDGTRFGSQLEDVLLSCGWDRPSNYVNLGSQQFIGDKPFEPVGVEIIATRPDQLYAASALELYLGRCGIKSKMTFNTNPPVMIKLPLIYIQIGSKN
jgi:hypothetical protein